MDFSPEATAAALATLDAATLQTLINCLPPMGEYNDWQVSPPPHDHLEQHADEHDEHALRRPTSLPMMASTSTVTETPTALNRVTSTPDIRNIPRARGTLSLQCTNDIAGMAKGWCYDEWRARRRLVQFWRTQHGTTINATCKPIAAQQYVPNSGSVVVSCIYWDATDECYITSVDVIYLLEALVVGRFNVEEKNRIRRNLEGLKPRTIGKVAKSSDAKLNRIHDDFFKLVMAFEEPRPRHIEKDIKIFPWKALAPALSKIVGKYSAATSVTDAAGGGGVQHEQQRHERQQQEQQQQQQQQQHQREQHQQQQQQRQQQRQQRQRQQRQRQRQQRDRQRRQRQQQSPHNHQHQQDQQQQQQQQQQQHHHQQHHNQQQDAPVQPVAPLQLSPMELHALLGFTPPQDFQRGLQLATGLSFEEVEATLAQLVPVAAAAETIVQQYSYTGEVQQQQYSGEMQQPSQQSPPQYSPLQHSPLQHSPLPQSNQYQQSPSPSPPQPVPSLLLASPPQESFDAAIVDFGDFLVNHEVV